MLVVSLMQMHHFFEVLFALMFFCIYFLQCSCIASALCYFFVAYIAFLTVLQMHLFLHGTGAAFHWPPDAFMHFGTGTVLNYPPDAFIHAWHRSLTSRCNHALRHRYSSIWFRSIWLLIFDLFTTLFVFFCIVCSHFSNSALVFIKTPPNLIL